MPAIASPATPRAAASRSRAGSRCRRRSARYITPNITPDPETGIGKWTADDFYRALHEGKSKDGSLLYPAFPYPSYTKVTRADSDAIYGYIQTITPVKKKNKPHAMQVSLQPAQPADRMARAVLPAGRVQARSQASRRNGTAARTWCSASATATPATRAATCWARRVKDKELSGGLIPLQDWYAPSLTSNREAGLGQWEVEEVVALLRTGISNRGVVFGPDGAGGPRQPAIHHRGRHAGDGGVLEVARDRPMRRADPGQLRTTEAQSRASYESGAKVYDQHCKSCHGTNGLGVPPMYPPLANNQAINMEFSVNPIRMVLFGGFPPSTRGNPRPFGMPPFAYTLSDQEVADVVTYMRQSWGNRSSAVSPVEVAKYRTVPVD